MGPPSSGKRTLCQQLLGNPDYTHLFIGEDAVTKITHLGCDEPAPDGEAAANGDDAEYFDPTAEMSMEIGLTAELPMEALQLAPGSLAAADERDSGALKVSSMARDVAITINDPEYERRNPVDVCFIVGEANLTPCNPTRILASQQLFIKELCVWWLGLGNGLVQFRPLSSLPDCEYFSEALCDRRIVSLLIICHDSKHTLFLKLFF